MSEKISLDSSDLHYVVSCLCNGNLKWNTRKMAFRVDKLLPKISHCIVCRIFMFNYILDAKVWNPFILIK